MWGWTQSGPVESEEEIVCGFGTSHLALSQLVRVECVAVDDGFVWILI